MFTMIIRIRQEANSEDRTHLLMLVNSVTGSSHLVTTMNIDEQDVIVLDGSQIDEQAHLLLAQHDAVDRITTVKTPYKLVSRAFKPQGSSIVVGDALGGEPVTLSHGARTDRLPVMIAGPCSVEGKEQILTAAQAIKAAGGRILRGGAFKPRTSPYQFQGLGIEGLEMLAQARNATGLPIITEVMEPELVATVAQYADILQIGSRNMQNYPLLRAAGRDGLKRPVMLKRGWPRPSRNGCWQLNTLWHPATLTSFCASAAFAASIPRRATSSTSPASPCCTNSPICPSSLIPATRLAAANLCPPCRVPPLPPGLTH
jgi:3-deoxy-7-phosphoheptulonate synthase